MLFGTSQYRITSLAAHQPPLPNLTSRSGVHANGREDSYQCNQDNLHLIRPSLIDHMSHPLLLVSSPNSSQVLYFPPLGSCDKQHRTPARMMQHSGPWRAFEPRQQRKILSLSIRKTRVCTTPLLKLWPSLIVAT